MPNDTSSKVPRWRWAVLGLLVVGTLSVPTGIVYLQHRLQVPTHDTARPWDDPKVAQKLTDARLVKAKAIRAEWRSWALQHKTALRAMLASQGKNFSTLLAVYRVSPPLRSGDWKPDTNTGPVKFSWYVDTEKQIANGEIINWADTESRVRQQTATEEHKVEKWLRAGFADKSDYIVASTTNAGPSTHLWASGRITEMTLEKNPDHRRGQRSFLGFVHKELMPPFDFLTSASSG